MATAKLTKELIEAATPERPTADAKDHQPGAVQAYVWDVRTENFGIVIGASAKTFVARAWVHKDGKALKRRVVIGRFGAVRPDGGTWTVESARDAAVKLLGVMKGGVDPNAAKHASARGPTLREALDFHLGKMERGERRSGKVCSDRSIKTIRGSVELHLAPYLTRPLIDLTADVIDTVRTKIEAEATRLGGSNPNNPPGRAASNRILANVSAIWRSYHKRYGLPVSNPIERLTPAAFDPMRNSSIPNAGLPAWHATVMAIKNPVRRDLQLVALFTGVRTDGVRNLRWDDIDFDADTFHVARAKGNRPYTLPMTKTVRDIFEARQEANTALPELSPFGGDHGFVFPSLARDGVTVQAVAEVKERRTTHDAEGNALRETYLPGIQACRKTFNRVAIEAGVPKEARESLMNHEGRGVNVRHYGRPENWDYLSECSAKVEAALWQHIKGTRPAKNKKRGKLKAV